MSSCTEIEETPVIKKIRKGGNLWSMEEIQFFVSLIKEKQVLGLMDGKRIRVSDIFKTLIAPMKERGYIRDVNQLMIKYKNLKAEYYKCKRHNSVSGNDHMVCDFYAEMDDLLGNRPLSQVDENCSMGFESLSEIPVINENDLNAVNRSLTNVDVEMYEDIPDTDGAIPGCSKDLSTTPSRPKTFIKKRNKEKRQHQELFDKLNENREKEAEMDRELFDRFASRSEQMMLKCTKMLLSVMEKILLKKTEKIPTKGNNIYTTRSSSDED